MSSIRAIKIVQVKGRYKGAMGIESNKVPIRNYYPTESSPPPTFLQYRHIHMYNLTKLIRVHTTACIYVCALITHLRSWPISFMSAISGGITSKHLVLFI